ncbi:thioredoxin domain-containing protein [Lactococcus petauri]|uniref:thioredoxin domain-containing protein n=1 Tax=Lactococcus petauri TaxID=1940789 RepID=UPI001EDDBE9B|nr:thioredoxin domain-containing protein [Lactococcus petauri]MCG3097465.1 thioredoxin domain-containing protein [Lactococcus petauri]
MNKKNIGSTLFFLVLLLFAGFIVYDRHQTESNKTVIRTIKEDKINFFYRDDCKDCKKIFKQVYLHNLIKQDIQFINLKQIKNRHYIDEYNIHTVPTFIYKNKAYAGTNTAHLNKFFTGE